MLRRGAWLSGAVLVFAAGPVFAGAWNLPKGEGQVIVKYEPEFSTRAFDQDGDTVALPVDRKDQIVSVWAEYGVHDRVTVLVKTDWQDSRDEYTDFSGRGLLEIGLRTPLVRTNRAVVAVQASYAHDGNGRNASWAGPGEGEHEGEIRLLAGYGFQASRPMFVEGQIARRWRDGLPDETRLEATMGMDWNDDWSMLWQVYAGRVDAESGVAGPEWIKLESGIIRHFDSWSVQGGWRSTFSGREMPAGHGPIVALWKRF